MKKILLSFGLLLSVNFSLKAQSKIKIEDFTALTINSSINIELIQGEENYIQIDDDEYDSSNLVATVNKNNLTINYANGKKPKTNLKIHFKNIESIDNIGSGNIKSEGFVVAENFLLNKTGSGNVNLKLKSEKIICDLSGSGDVELEGETKKLEVNKSGAGTFKSYQLISSEVKVNASGVGTVKVYASDALTANASGIGDILYIGKPKTVNVDISGIGTVREIPFIEKTASDTTKLILGGKKIIILDDDNSKKRTAKSDTTLKKYPVKNIYKGFEIGINGYTTKTNNFAMDKAYDYLSLNYGKSINLNINLAEYHIRLYKNYIALTTGGGFEFNRYFFSKSNMSLLPTKDTVSAATFGVNFKKNILKTSNITIPLLLQFTTHKNPDKAFHFAAGGYFSYNLNSKLKQIYTLGSTDYKVKTNDSNNFNLSPFKYGAMLRMGYKKVNVYATYAMSNLFQTKTVGPELQPFSVGISLIPF